MKIRLKHIDAFTDTPLTGNPAGVVVNADGLTDQQMQRIAFEVRASETAFVLPPETPEAQLRIRWFTPSAEVPLCGHATIASFHALAEEKMMGMDGAGSYKFQLETKSGSFPFRSRSGPTASTCSSVFPCRNSAAQVIISWTSCGF